MFNGFNIFEEYQYVKRSGIGFKRLRVGFTNENGSDRCRFCWILKKIVNMFGYCKKRKHLKHAVVCDINQIKTLVLPAVQHIL